MAPPANLSAAAAQCSLDMTTLYFAATIEADFNAFWSQINNSGVFEDQHENDHPVINWIAIIAALAQTGFGQSTATENVQNPVQQLQESILATYRMLRITSFLVSEGLCTSSQGAVVLASYNAHLSTT